MEIQFNNGNPVVRLRAFRAVDDPRSCELFVEGHKRVLTSIGVEKVTSSNNEWVHNPAAFVMIVESLDKEHIYGGARIHVAGGTEPLPIEQATGALDPSIYDLVYDFAQKGTGEGCGLWNSREIAGYGIGSIFLTRVGVAMSTQIGLDSLFGLCAPYTVKMAQSVGYEIEEGIGNKGTFYYPKLDLVATVLILRDLQALSTADDENKLAIQSLRQNLQGVRIEELRKKKIEIHYDIEIPNMDKWDLQATIANLKKGSSNGAIDESKINLL
ncbi:hypothetical protein [Daejeonella lutea]|uniref:N-acetyltransferase domain-containing protein n=1 Tax=Daejeonella lutea TaxID=572036 RepID=A0A1T5DI58_9SPHI|nr:hypothetical protein [Daejeonella lutea]SKB71415.1 hypothetical protein SAMN05661099_2367 [Daejeonella lutea]